MKRVIYYNSFEGKHPIIHFLTVRPTVCVGKVWLRLLTTKQHPWAMAGSGLFRNLVWFGPSQHPGHYRAAPILVLAGGARRGSDESSPTQVGDYEPSTQNHD